MVVQPIPRPNAPISLMGFSMFNRNESDIKEGRDLRREFWQQSSISESDSPPRFSISGTTSMVLNFVSLKI